MVTRTSLTEAEHARVSAAVTAAEAHSAGEIVTILTDRSDGYSDVAFAWAALVAFLALALIALDPGLFMGFFDGLTGAWAHEWTAAGIVTLTGGLATLAFLATWLIQLSAAVRFALVPAPIKHERVRARAVAAFRIGAERRTTGRTGILIYLSMREHRAEIVADEAIASKVPAEVWGEAMAALLPELRAGRVSAGLCAAIARVGAVLAEQLPRLDDDVNELPDRLIEI